MCRPRIVRTRMSERRPPPRRSPSPSPTGSGRGRSGRSRARCRCRPRGSASARSDRARRSSSSDSSSAGKANATSSSQPTAADVARPPSPASVPSTTARLEADRRRTDADAERFAACRTRRASTGRGPPRRCRTSASNDGGCRAAPRSIAKGSYVASTCGQIAAITNSADDGRRDDEVPRQGPASRTRVRSGAASAVMPSSSGAGR